MGEFIEVEDEGQAGITNVEEDTLGYRGKER